MYHILFLAVTIAWSSGCNAAETREHIEVILMSPRFEPKRVTRLRRTNSLEWAQIAVLAGKKQQMIALPANARLKAQPPESSSESGAASSGTPSPISQKHPYAVSQRLDEQFPRLPRQRSHHQSERPVSSDDEEESQQEQKEECRPTPRHNTLVQEPKKKIPWWACASSMD